MDIHDYIITDSLTEALDTICKHCTRQICTTCEIFELRVKAEYGQIVSNCEEEFENSNHFTIPDTFAFQTKIKLLAKHALYHAQKHEDQYIVYFPAAGCVYHFSIEHMCKQVIEGKYVIVSVND